mmetsp:Transcript_29746/g.64813  ORF Transcript_29746/g.64813 Transcript_29746/m.64813 type:complete len:169 (-) Transcript_29746:216-722(-)
MTVPHSGPEPDSSPGHTIGLTRLCSELDGCFECFLCFHCKRYIKDGESVYMCRDTSYCSQRCRRKGMKEAKRRSSKSSAASVTTLSSWSESTMSSSAASRSPQAAGSARNGLLGWIVDAALSKLTSMVDGHEFLRTLSNPAMHGFGVASPPSPSSQRHVYEVGDVFLE